jgi:hypothetical protein
MGGGHAAGLATVCAERNGVDFHGVDIAELHAMQKEDGCVFDVKDVI